MSEILLIDGHNVIHSTPELCVHHRNNQALARELLQGWLNHYQDITDYHIIVVFDGNQKNRHTEGGSPHEILTIYAEASTSADFIIESLARQQSKKHRVSVVSNDQAILHTVASYGAYTHAVLPFIKQLQNVLDSHRCHWEF